MLGCGICFSDLSDIINLSEKYIKFCLKYILNKNKENLNYIQNHYSKSAVIDNVTKLINSDFKKITYTEATEILNKASNLKKNLFVNSVTWGIQLSQEHERFLTDDVFKSAVFIYNYPKRVKSFYMRVNEDGETVEAMDLLVPGIGEIIGGSVREERKSYMKENIYKKFGIYSSKYDSYLDLRKFGTVPHSGFGVGFDRLVMVATGMNDIKDVIPYPKYPNYSEC